MYVRLIFPDKSTKSYDTDRMMVGDQLLIKGIAYTVTYCIFSEFQITDKLASQIFQEVRLAVSD